MTDDGRRQTVVVVVVQPEAVAAIVPVADDRSGREPVADYGRRCDPVTVQAQSVSVVPVADGRRTQTVTQAE